MKIFDFDKELDDLVNALINKCLSPKQRNRLVLYITLLSEENKKLKWRNDKAVEYINKRFIINEFGEYNLTHTFDKNNVKELLEILKGDNNVKY